MNLDYALQKHAKNIPEKLALGWESGSYTYRELNEKVDLLANQFFRSGIESGDRIAIILGNCSEFVIGYYACKRLGVISVPINPSFTSREFEVVINDSVPKIIITTEKVYKVLQKTKLVKNPEYYIVDGEEPNGFDSTETLKTSLEKKDTDESTILYTSGTTGVPKGAVLTHQNLYHNAKTFAEAFGMKEDVKTLIVAPLFHTAAQSNCLNSTLYSGGYSYLLPRWESSSKTLSAMQDQEITFFFGPPTMYIYMLKDPDIKKYKLSLRFAYTGAAPLPKNIFNQWRDTLGFEIVEGYGLTECAPVVSINPPYGKKKIGSIGIPIKDVKVKIVNELFEEVPNDESGELLVQGPNVMKGYFNLREETKAAFVDGWFRTGDVAKKDEDGYLYIIDRKKDMIIRSGFNVYPREVEEVLYLHPAIFEVAVIGYADTEKGELIKVFVVLKDGYDETIISDLKDYCKERLATYKVPQQFEVVKELPKTSSGKIIKAKLKEIHA